VTTFAGIRPEDVAFFVERVELTDKRGVDEAFARWKLLEREGWSVTALVDVGSTHMVGLGCCYAGQLVLRTGS
jgi:hypothetical protein